MTFQYHFWSLLVCLFQRWPGGGFWSLLVFASPGLSKGAVTVIGWCIPRGDAGS